MNNFVLYTTFHRITHLFFKYNSFNKQNEQFTVIFLATCFCYAQCVEIYCNSSLMNYLLKWLLQLNALLLFLANRLHAKCKWNQNIWQPSCPYINVKNTRFLISAGVCMLLLSLRNIFYVRHSMIVFPYKTSAELVRTIPRFENRI